MIDGAVIKRRSCRFGADNGACPGEYGIGSAPAEPFCVRCLFYQYMVCAEQGR